MNTFQLIKALGVNCGSSYAMCNIKEALIYLSLADGLHAVGFGVRRERRVVLAPLQYSESSVANPITDE